MSHRLPTSVGVVFSLYSDGTMVFTDPVTGEVDIVLGRVPGGGLGIGDSVTPPSTNPIQGVLLFSQGGILKYLNGQGLLNTVVGSQGGLVTSTTVANTTVESTLQTFALPAGDAVPGAMYHFMGFGVFSTASVAPTITFTLRLGGTSGTVLAQVPANTLTASLSNVTFKYEIWVNFLSPTSAQAIIDMGWVTTASNDSGTVRLVTPAVPVTVNTAAAQSIVLDTTWSATGNSITLLGGFTERLA